MTNCYTYSQIRKMGDLSLVQIRKLLIDGIRIDGRSIKLLNGNLDRKKITNMTEMFCCQFATVWGIKICMDWLPSLQKWVVFEDKENERT